MESKSACSSHSLKAKLRRQFDIRSEAFDASANWVTDKGLILAHIDMAGKPSGEALDLCCGTGQIGRALKAKGWKVRGLDICDSMVKISSRYFAASKAMAEKMPFESDFFNLVVCRQAFQFLNSKKTLAEVGRILSPGGVFVLSLTVPFSNTDKKWLHAIHRTKQPLLVKFYTARDLVDELRKAKFTIEEIRTVKVRESVTRWMQYAPELNQEVRDKVLSMVKNAPLSYKKLHHSEVVGGEVSEDWNWVILKAVFRKTKRRAIRRGLN